MQANGKWDDLIDVWLDYTTKTQSPIQFRLWAGIALVSAALERRVWTQVVGDMDTYPNIYAMLVAAPGIGKDVIERALGIMREVKVPGIEKPAFTGAADSATRASLMDDLAKARKIFLPQRGPPMTYHALAIFNPEIQVLLPQYDREFLSRMNRLFDAPRQHKETRRTGTVKELIMEKPILSALLGVQPSYLASTFPDDAWATGIGRRILMIYASEGPINPLFERSDPTQQTEEYLLQLLGVVALLSGPVQWTSEASELISKFNFDWRQRLADPLFPDVCDEWPIPIHSKLLHYNRSRTMFIIKLSMISAIAARHELVIRPSDILRALRWLLDAEILMPDIFREMRGKSDREVIDELHRFVINQWSKDKKKPGVPGSLMATFLSQRVPSEKVPSVLMLAERMDLIVRVAGTQDTWLPRPRFGAPGVE